MLKIIFRALGDMLVTLLELLAPIFDGIFTFGGSKNPHDFSGSFLNEEELLKKSNKGFCLTGNRSLSRQLSYRNGLVIGGTGTGKSATVLIPSILKMQGSMIINDPSGELYKLTSGFKSRAGFRTLVLDYSNPHESVGYNPIERADTVSDISKVASTLIRASLGDNAKDPFWTIQAVNLLVIPISLVKGMDRKYRNLANVRRLLQVMSGDPSKMDRLVVKHGDPHLLTSYKAFVAMSPKTFSSIAATALSALTLFQDEKVQKVTAIDTLDMERFREEKTVLYIRNSTIDMKYFAPLTSIFAEQFFGFVMSKVPEKKRGQDIFFLFDEASSLTLPSLPITIANIRKYRSGMLLACQEFRQIVQNYGKNDAESIRSNCYSKIYFTGQSLETARELEALLGKYTYKEEKGDKKSRSLKTADEIRTIPVNKSIIVCGHHRPIFATMLPYYENRKLLAKTVYECPESEGGANTEDVSFIPLR